jgi:hypothetical protein
MKNYITPLILLLLISCNGGGITYDRQRYGPPINLKIEQRGDTKIERLFWSHGRMADEKFFVENILKRHITYFPSRHKTEIDFITYFEGDKQLKYKDAGFSILKTLKRSNEILFHYEFKKDMSNLISLKATPLSAMDFKQYSHSKEDPQFK